MRKLIISLLLIVILLSGCTTPSKEDSKLAKELCVKKCQEALSNHENLSDGPCLSNEIIKDWVCDVAHSPRQDVDNLRENQCDAWHSKQARHFVEVDPECRFIKAY